MLRSTREAAALGLCLVGVAGLVGRSFGQNPQDGKVRQTAAAASNAPSTPVPVGPASIGTIDMENVLKNYDKVKVAAENLRAEMLARHNELMKVANDARQEQEKLQRMGPGTPDAKKSEDRFTQLKAQMEAGRENAEREFQQKEAETMATIYNEVQTMTKGVAQQRGMTFVVRYSDAQVQGSEPNSVMAAMQRTVVFADTTKSDITADVVKWLNYRYKASGGPAPKGNAAPAAAATTPAQAPAARPAAPGGN